MIMDWKRGDLIQCPLGRNETVLGLITGNERRTRRGNGEMEIEIEVLWVDNGECTNESPECVQEYREKFIDLLRSLR
jgi:hypothetical protein